MKRLSVLYVVLGASLVACSRTPGPSPSELRERLTVDLPNPWVIDSFSVEASENVGSKVEPIVKNRFKATLEASDDTFTFDHREADVSFLKPAVSKGDERELYGVATSAPKAGSWQTAYDFENNPFSDSGKARSGYQGQTIVIGSNEETEYRARLAREEEQRQASAALAARERTQTIAHALASGRVFGGAQTTRQGTFRFQIHFQSFNQATGAVKGENRWFSGKTGELKPPNTLAGTLVGDTLSLTEQVRGGEHGDDFALNYSLTLAPSMRQLEGQSTAGHATAQITIDLQ